MRTQAGQERDRCRACGKIVQGCAGECARCFPLSAGPKRTHSGPAAVWLVFQQGESFPLTQGDGFALFATEQEARTYVREAREALRQRGETSGGDIDALTPVVMIRYARDLRTMAAL